MRAKEEEEAEQLKADALLLQEAGCFGIVLEKIPQELAAEVSKSLSIPTIGIGAGSHCDGQVLVTHDALGLTTDFNPRFVRRYGHLDSQIAGMVQYYISDVRSRSFPTDEESY